MNVTCAVIPAAGFGTRFLPATKGCPKEMVPVVDKPVIQHVVEEAAAAGCTDIILVISTGKRAIEDHFSRMPEMEHILSARGDTERLALVRSTTGGANIHYVFQPEMRGLGDAIRQARHHVGSRPFAVLLGDTVMESAAGTPNATAQLCAVHAQHGQNVIALSRVPKERISRYGVAALGQALGEDTWQLSDLVEKPKAEEAPSDLAVTARYVLTPEIFAAIDRTQPGKGGEIQITDAIRQLCPQGKVQGRRIAARRHDIGSPLDFLMANVELGLSHPTIGPELRKKLKTLGL